VDITFYDVYVGSLNHILPSRDISAVTTEKSIEGSTPRLPRIGGIDFFFSATPNYFAPVFTAAGAADLFTKRIPSAREIQRLSALGAKVASGE